MYCSSLWQVICWFITFGMKNSIDNFFLPFITLSVTYLLAKISYLTEMHIGLNAKIGSWYKNIIFHLITLIGIWYTLLIRNISSTYQPINLAIWLNAKTALSNTSSVHQNTYQLCIPKHFAATQHQAFLTVKLPHVCTTTLLQHP